MAPVPFFMGVELEIDKGDNVRECASALKTLSEREDYFYLKSDGSLDNGIEIVTHPCSLEYHENSFPWKEVVKTGQKNTSSRVMTPKPVVCIFT